MDNRYRLQSHRIEIDKHPTWATAYIQTIDIVDLQTGLTVNVVEAFSKKDGITAVTEARLEATRWIADREEQEKLQQKSLSGASEGVGR